MNPGPMPMGALNAELDAHLRARARRQRLGRGEVLFLRGSAPDALYCVDVGVVRLCVTSSSGREAVLGLVTPGHWFGEASLFTGEPRSHDALAVVDSELLAVPAAALHELVDGRPAYLLQFLRLMGLRYRSTLERLDDAALQPLPVRLARKLLEMSRSDATATAGDGVLQISQEDLAHALGVSRQSINRILKRWEAAGVLQVNYRSLVLLKPEALGFVA
ncbi:Crp/Fnr family transcriptional regulator [Phenylobacterium zucineum]|nr:Crp/Fnr family transcriptional regulator [Phenylobacterium zucineum]